MFVRGKGRPIDSGQFDINMEAIPDNCLVADITVAQRRHLMFSTPHQLELLANARHYWYMDATFRLAREPFTQLFTINVFIRSDDNV